MSTETGSFSSRAILVVAIALGAIAACAPRPPAPPARQEHLRLPVEESSAFRGRFVAGKTTPLAVDDWTEIAVAGTTTDAKLICEVLLRQREREANSLGLQTRIVRNCDATPLPAVEIARDEHLLIVRERSDSAALILAAAVAERALADVDHLPSTLVRHTTRFGDGPSCSAALGELSSRRRAAREASEREARAWLEEQRRTVSAQASRWCDEPRTSCTALKDGAIEAACRTPGPRCQETKQRALTYESCKLEAERLARDCEQQRAMVRELDRRLAESGVLEEDPAPTCVPVLRVVAEPSSPTTR